MTNQTINVHPWVQDLAEGFPLKNGWTNTTYTGKVDCSNEQKRQYAETLLEGWADANFYPSGVRIIRTSLTRNTSRDTEGKLFLVGNYAPRLDRDWELPDSPAEQLEIRVELGFPGEIDFSNTSINRDLIPSITRGVRKGLALRAVDEFPLPFGKTLDALSMYDTDILMIVNQQFTDHTKYDSPHFSGGLNGIMSIIKEFSSEYPIHFGYTVYECWRYAQVSIVWLDSVTDLDRTRILEALKKALSEHGNSRSKSIDLRFLAV